MTDPNLADSTYIEPLTTEHLEKIIKRETRCIAINNGRTNSIKYFN